MPFAALRNKRHHILYTDVSKPEEFGMCEYIVHGKMDYFFFFLLAPSDVAGKSFEFLKAFLSLNTQTVDVDVV